MVTHWKKGIALVVLVCICVLCFGCVMQTVGETAPRPTPPPPPELTSAPPVPEVSEHPLKQAYTENPTAFVLFTQSIEPKEVYVPVEEILNYESLYPECGATWFRDRLEQEDRCIYNSYLYAMEHCLTGFTVYVEDNDRDFGYVREALSLDLPFVEQNIYCEDIHGWANTHWGESVHFSVSHFTQDRWNMKLEALEKCRQIVAEIPAEYETQLQKMEYLYRYVCDHVEYVEYEEMKNEDFLYDGVIKGQTVCDGYSNMLSLLFNLIGVECCEVTGSNVQDYANATEEERENARGHTWVAAKVGDQYYNFDPTYEDSKDETWGIDTMYFAFSDALVEQTYLDCEDIRPKCTDPSLDFDYTHLVISTLSDQAQIKQLVELAQDRIGAEDNVLLVGIGEPLDEAGYNRLIDTYTNYATKEHRIEAQYVRLQECTLLWLTVLEG